jgi:hypothetical protein
MSCETREGTALRAPYAREGVDEFKRELQVTAGVIRSGEGRRRTPTRGSTPSMLIDLGAEE